MNIVIIANFPSKIEGEKEKGRFLYLGEMLADKGHSVTMLVSDFMHATKEKRSYIYDGYKTKIIALHEPGYKNNISIKRLWSHFRWGKNVYKYLKSHQEPDVIYCAVPSLTAGVMASRYCQMRSVKFIIDIQDLWPEAFLMKIHIRMLQKALLPLTWYANRIYKAADFIVAVSNTYVNRALSINNKIREGISVFLGNDGQFFDQSKHENNNPTGTIKIAYIGTLSYSYDIKCVMDALVIYNNYNNLPKVLFVVMGDGPLRSEFENYAELRGVDVEFTGKLPYSNMVSKLCNCDIVVNPIVKGSAASIINKVGDYALSGLPVINTQESQEYRNLIEKYQCGINCNCADAEDVAEAIIKLVKDENLRKRMGGNSRLLGEERFDRRFTYKVIVDLIEKNGKSYV